MLMMIPVHFLIVHMLFDQCLNLIVRMMSDQFLNLIVRMMSDQFLIVRRLMCNLMNHLVMNSAGLATDDSEVMWATLTQLLLAAETGVATLLWASRRREGKLRVGFLGGAVVLTQLAAVFGTYGLEVEHVALTNGAASPLLLNAEVSPYWLGFLVLCWSAGLALIFTALMRRRDERKAEEAAEQSFDDDFDDDFGMPGRRLIH